LRSRGGFACLTAAITVGIGSAAAAQTLPGSTQRFQFEVRAHVVHDTNIAGGDPTFATLRGVSASDTIYSPGASVTVNLPVGRQGLFLTASGDLQRYEKNKQLNSDDIVAAGGVRGRFGPCAETVSVGYSRQLTAGAELLIPIAKNVGSEKYVDGSFRCTRGRMVAGVQARYTRVDNSADNQGLVNYDSTSVSANAGYAGGYLGDLTILGEHSDVNYDRAPLVTPVPGVSVFGFDGYESYEVGVRYFRRIGLRLSGTADFTYNHTKSKIQTNVVLPNPRTEFSGWSADVLMDYRVSTRTQVDFQYARQVEPSQIATAGFDVAETLKLSGSHRLGQRMSVTGGVSRVKTNYSHSQVSVLGLLQNDTVDTFYATGTMEVGRHVRVSLDAQHLDRSSNQPLFNYQSDRIGITLAGDF
jgi:hypothetical protein